MNPSKPIVLSIVILVSVPAAVVGQITRSFTEPVEIRHVAANQPDVVTVLKVAEGSRIGSGDAIAELDNSVLRKQLQIAKLRASSNASINAALVELESKKNKAEQLRGMLQKGHANPAEVEQAETAFKSANAELELAQEKKKEFELEVERIEAEIERNVIRSPIDGIVTEVHVHPGEFIASKERKLATVVRLNQLRVRFYLLERTTQKLYQGQTVELALGKSRDRVVGVLEFVSPVIDPDSGTSRVDIIFENPELRFSSGSVCYWLNSASHVSKNKSNTSKVDIGKVQ